MRDSGLRVWNAYVQRNKPTRGYSATRTEGMGRGDLRLSRATNTGSLAGGTTSIPDSFLPGIRDKGPRD